MCARTVQVRRTATTTARVVLNLRPHPCRQSAASKVKGPVPKFFDEFLTSGIDATYSTAHATPFYGVIIVDGADDLFSWPASSAALYSPGPPTEIARDAFLFTKPIAVVGSTGKAALKAAEVDENQDGILVMAPRASTPPS